MTIKPIRLARRGLLFVLSSPSGAGKSTLAHWLLSEESGLALSISVTTRPRRPSEIEGRHYRFVAERDFRRKVDRDELLEWAEVHDNLYGTPRDPVERALAEGRDVLFDIDWQGSRQLAEKNSDDLVRVFILPPSLEELKARLERRAEDDAATIARRLEAARHEMEHWREYDYVVVNDDLDRAFTELRAILAAERLRRDRLEGLEAFVDGLMAAQLREKGVAGAMIKADKPL
jgi:guanylate kinase